MEIRKFESVGGPGGPLLPPGGTPPPGGLPPGPDFGPQNLSPEEQERLRREGAQVVFEGQEFMKAINETPLENLPVIINDVLGFKEGLRLGIDGYELDDPLTLGRIKAMFTSVDSSVDRPQNPYLEPSLRQKVGEKVREIKLRARVSGGFKDEESHLVEKLVAVDRFIEARRLVDYMFIQRQTSCESPDTVAELMNKGPFTPDADAWEAFFQADKKFGEAANEVLKRIVKVAHNPSGYADRKIENVPGIPQTVYAEGFADKNGIPSSVVFKKWLEYLLEGAEGRMDVVWAAWKLALAWEIPNEFGKGKVTTSKGQEVYVLADPPIGSALFTWTAHLAEKRALEYGWDVNDKRIAGTKFISHSGLPLTIPLFKNLCRDYLHNSTISISKDGKMVKKNLFDVWWGTNGEDGVSFADPRFPWLRTEEQTTDENPGEVAAGSVGGWFLRRFRGNEVRKQITMVAEFSGNPDYNLAHHNFFASKLRNWSKLGLIDPESKLPTAEYPPAAWLASQLYYRLAGPDEHVYKKQITGKNADMEYRTSIAKERPAFRKAGRETKGETVFEDILMSAARCGFIRGVDVAGIKNMLEVTLVGI
jgi:hypothetical protein